MWNLKYDTDELIYKTEIDSKKTNYVHQRGGDWWRNKLGI